MALENTEFFQTNPGVGSGLRAFPDSVQPKEFGTDSNENTLARLTPVAYNTSTNEWVVFANGGANGTGEIQGFVWPDEIKLDNTNEVLGNVMLSGRIHRDDIPVVSGFTQQNLDDALAGGDIRDKGFIVEGLANFR